MLNTASYSSCMCQAWPTLWVHVRLLLHFFCQPSRGSEKNICCHRPQQGLASIIANVDMDKVSQGMSATLQAGIDPTQLIERFQQSPSLAKAMENPRVLAALMDMAR